MSGALDSTARKTSERLLKKFGKKAVYVEVSEGVYDPDIGTVPIIETNHDVTCFIDEAKAGSLKSSGLINADDLVVLVSAKELNLEVDNTDKISFDGKTYSIIKDIPVWSGEQIALHNIVCKNS
ncbi:MAG: hypothetical protein GQ570_11780 [Helicobacteraceae bacterium]|nr:hypothetical protein [Helicobacteraceae bacterium]